VLHDPLTTGRAGTQQQNWGCGPQLTASAQVDQSLQQLSKYNLIET